jgi:hypothetical protein
MMGGSDQPRGIDPELNEEGQGGSDLPAGLSQPAQRALRGAGLTTLDEISRWTTAELGRLHGIGPRAIQTLKDALKERGLPALDGPTR